ncbi:MAG: transposase [Phycisphaerales bacterium]
MESAFRPYEPDQHLLLPPSLREWLPGGHLSHFVSDTVDQLDLGPILSWYRGREQGNLPYHPAMMLKVLVYCYCTGTFSSRRIAKAIEDLSSSGSSPRATRWSIDDLPPGTAPRRLPQRLSRRWSASRPRPDSSRSGRSPSTARRSGPMPASGRR